jgi:hypothetical protein
LWIIRQFMNCISSGLLWCLTCASNILLATWEEQEAQVMVMALGPCYCQSCHLLLQGPCLLTNILLKLPTISMAILYTMPWWWILPGSSPWRQRNPPGPWWSVDVNSLIPPSIEGGVEATLCNNPIVTGM